MHVAEREEYHLIDDLWLVLLPILKIRNFAGGFLVTIIFSIPRVKLPRGQDKPVHRYQSGPDFSEMNNDADLIFIMV